MRPICFANERLYKWLPAVSRQDRGVVAESDLQNITNVLSHSWADGTLETYGSGLLIFHCFCDSRNIPESARTPASPDLLAAFLAAAVGSYAGKTLENYLSGVCAWHILHGVPWGPNKDECTALLRAAAALQPKSSQRKKRLPYTVDIINTLLSQLDPTVPLDASVSSYLTTGYYSCARIGELTVKTLQSFDPAIHVKPSDVREETDPNGLLITVLGVPVTKSNQDGEDLFHAAQHGPSDPRHAFQNHLSVNAPPANGHLFSYKHKGAHRPLTKTTFISRLHKAFKAVNLDPLQGDGIRIGATLFYLPRGTPFDIVKTMGRWSSDAFLLYLRKHAQILAPYMQANPQLHSDFVRIAMPPVRCEFSLLLPVGILRGCVVNTPY
ncbi:hypothetical protein DFH07DRAFT_957616 [Mycena maculata]|uniref:Uncharacterized protein n=1 Tax=Mycena maculata TaxID=230809 RepID=A0AAD7JB81_9AGAR|nr:hypothetical protein DFH07DRAFT_957616 [Mycena maculata]